MSPNLWLLALWSSPLNNRFLGRSRFALVQSFLGFRPDLFLFSRQFPGFPILPSSPLSNPIAPTWAKANIWNKYSYRADKYRSTICLLPYSPQYIPKIFQTVLRRHIAAGSDLSNFLLRYNWQHARFLQPTSLVRSSDFANA